LVRPTLGMSVLLGGRVIVATRPQDFQCFTRLCRRRHSVPGYKRLGFRVYIGSCKKAFPGLGDTFVLCADGDTPSRNIEFYEVVSPSSPFSSGVGSPSSWQACLGRPPWTLPGAGTHLACWSCTSWFSACSAPSALLLYMRSPLCRSLMVTGLACALIQS